MSLSPKTVLLTAFQLTLKSLLKLPDTLRAKFVRITPMILTTPTLRYGPSGYLKHAFTCTI